MSDDLYDDDEQETNPVRQQREHIKQLEQKLAEAEAKAQAAERRQAFLDAGVNPSDPKAKYFVNGYDGDVSVDAIKQAAIEAGFIANPDEASQEQPKADDLGAFQRASQAAAGSMVPPPPTNALAQMRQQVEMVGPKQLDALRQQAMQAIREAGLEFDSFGVEGGLESSGADPLPKV